MVRMIAGFECGHVNNGAHKLLQTTLHLPDARMVDHYRVAAEHGITWARDGIPPDCDPLSHIRSTGDARVFWDLNHYWDFQGDPEGYARKFANAAVDYYGDRDVWVCPCNEPNIVSLMQPHISCEQAMEVGLAMLAVVKQIVPNVKVLTADPIRNTNGPWNGTDLFAEHADIIGTNVYPHTANFAPIRDILRSMYDRYGKPTMVSETSWHDGYHSWPNVHNKGEWLEYVVNEVEAAGVPCVGICWYPFIDCPPWEQPESSERWSHGLIRHDLSVDPMLTTAIKKPRKIYDVC